MSNTQIKENEFFGAPGGANGTVNYQAPIGIHTSPEASQNPNQFGNSNNNKAVNQNSNTAKEPPNKASMDAQVNAIYAKKEVPTPDEVVAGMKYEMGQQIKKDKAQAKQTVLDNLKKDPKFYSSLRMLGIDDDPPYPQPPAAANNNMNEAKHPNDAPARTKITPNIEVTKQIFAEMSKGKDQKYVVNSQICDVMKEMWAAKKARNSWRG